MIKRSLREIKFDSQHERRQLFIITHLSTPLRECVPTTSTEGRCVRAQATSALPTLMAAPSSSTAVTRVLGSRPRRRPAHESPRSDASCDGQKEHVRYGRGRGGAGEQLTIPRKMTAGSHGASHMSSVELIRRDQLRHPVGQRAGAGERGRVQAADLHLRVRHASALLWRTPDEAWQPSGPARRRFFVICRRDVFDDALPPLDLRTTHVKVCHRS